MSKDYEEFIKYVYYEHIEKRLTYVRDRFWPRHLEKLGHRVARLTRATRAVRFIEDFPESDEEIIRIFTPEMLERTLREIRYSAELNNDLVVGTGIADVIQDYFGEIVEGMSVDHFPKEDIEALRQSGSSDPQRDIVAMVYLVKSRKEQLVHEGREVRFSRRLEQVTERIERIEKSLPKEPPEPNQATNQQPTVKRATVKGVGSIAQGVLMTTLDITLAAGWWSVPLPPETRSVGAVVSATSGIGMILTGIGELRGE